ncbi:hypothetical protein CALVIDRAFT_533227 [Calocera viscosa TUFC12733]|uniref:SGT1-domain-containing protein n=1 Tax=Calocera viscosa (strain TUFC12733) TaxID=1330018 RepID=A0A167RGY0_CALVF|nr:hypothetical protein CALVIDRAFT_533227 [Calocera viscosa TUFC12733]
MSTDIFNRPPSINDDTLSYALHFPAAQSTPAELLALAALILEHVRKLLPQDFLWHRDAFELRLASHHSNGNAKGKGKAKEEEVKEGELWLEGTMRVGDSVDDEWAAVWLLWEVSALWDCVISVRDSDGQFLLIEAAETLPAWVTPSNAENRVWISHSQLHLIPLSHTSPAASRPQPLHSASSDEDFTDADTWLSTPDALRLVRDSSISTVAPPPVQSALHARLSRYPHALLAHTHHTLTLLPLPLARALRLRPQLAQRASEAFYTRDALQLRSAHKMSRFPPSPAVLTRVSMTRVAYAQLRGQRWTPPRVFGPAPQGERERRWWEVGAMLAAGSEMLYQETHRPPVAVDGRGAGEARLEALQRDPGWGEYLKRLGRAGWFGEEREGSRQWKEREGRAAEAYVTARASENATRPSFASLVETALAGPLLEEEALEVSPGAKEDDEAWLNVGPEELEGLLERASGNPTAGKGSAPQDPRGSAPENGGARITELTEDKEADVDMDMDAEEERVASREAERLREMARRVEEFVDGEGDVEGATFPDDILEEDMGDSDDDSDMDDEAEVELTSEEKKAAMDRLVQPLAVGEYGRMPEDWSRPAPMSDAALAEAEARQAAVSAAAKGKEKESIVALEPLDMTSGHRAPLFGRESYEGHSSDSELDEAGQGLSDSEEEGEDAPQVVGELEPMDIEPDMQQEEEDFLAFARRELGISEQGWGEIVRQREGEGRFVPVPRSAGRPEEGKGTLGPEPPKSKEKGKPKPPAMAEKATEKAVRWMDAAPKPADRTPRERKQGGPRPDGNPNLDSFERVMEAMEEELARAKAEKTGKGKEKARETAKEQPKAEPDVKGKGKAPAPAEDEDEEDEDEMLRAMDAELRSALKQGDGEGEDGAGAGSDEEEAPMDYNLIKNFLESFKSQAGLAGPVSGMVGRLDKGWVWPRDEGES